MSAIYLEPPEDLLALYGSLEAASPPRRHPDPEKLSFVDWVRRVRPKYQWYAHARRAAAVLQRVADGELSRVMMFEPPRHGKSERVSRLFSAYYLYRYPERWVGLTSYGANLAYTFSRAARDNYKECGGTTRGDADAVTQWETTEGGGCWAAGVGGAITGKGFHLGIIDDPVKNAKEAGSETIQAAHVEWYDSTFYTREEPDGAIILIQTRWNEEDLAGQILAREAEDDPERWHIVCFPAIKEEEPKPEEPPQFPATCTVEPDPRAPGEPLCPERYPLAKLTKIWRRIGEYFWSALYRQRPAPKAGIMFQREWFDLVGRAPAGTRWVRYWDKAGTEGGGAYSAGVLVGECNEIYYIGDVVRGQWSSGARDTIIAQTAALDRVTYGYVATWIEQEGGSGGKQSAEISVRQLAGFTVSVDRVTGDKLTRARPLSSQAEFRNVKLVIGAWNRAFLDEAVSFPNGTYKDQIDAAAGGFNQVALAFTKAKRLTGLEQSVTARLRR